MKREKALAVNTIMLGIGYVVPFVVNMLFLPVYTSKLSQEEYGIYDFISVISSLLITITTLQIKQAGMRYLMKYRNTNEEKETQKVITNVLSFVFVSSLLLFIIVLFVLRGSDGATRVLIAVYFAVQVHVDTLKQLIRGLGKNKEYVIGVVVQTLSSFLLVVAFLTSDGAGLNGLLFANVIAFIMAGVYLGYQVPVHVNYSVKLVSVSYMCGMLKFSTPIVFSSISIWIVKLSDRLVVTFFLGAASNGIYSVANKIPNLLSQVFEVFNLAWQENASITIDDKDSDAYYSRVFKAMFAMLLGMACVLAGIMPFMFQLLVDDSFDSAYYQVPILIAAFFFASLNGYFGNIYFALERPIINAYSTIIGAVINLAICLALINKIGIYAASISTLVSYMLITGVRFFTVLKWKKMDYDYLSIVGGLVVFFLFCSVCYVRNAAVLIVNAAIAIAFAVFINREFLQESVKLITARIGRRK
ncbi:MAG: oligosaccharide flippase family protein [Lachnospiraceae bacterium]|nr:oligosaccharide flippase family protein [Lachnospiraceae bacterium]